MKFRTELDLPKASFELNYSSNILFIGSCFSSNMYSQLKDRGFKYIYGNPFGVLFNPVSITNVLNDIIDEKQFLEDEFFENQERFRHWDFGSHIFRSDLKNTVRELNNEIVKQNKFLKNVDVLYVTLGTSWVYELIKSKEIVANCHKMHPSLFNKRLLKMDEINDSIEGFIKKMQIFNSKIKIVFTISPIRHVKNGIIDDQRSKSLLLVAIHDLIDQYGVLSYFPSYEFLMDDLRDYRFYTKDLIHPNDQAIDYIWDKFSHHYFSSKTINEMKKVLNLKKILYHRPINGQSDDKQLINESLETKIIDLKRSVDFEL